MKSEETIFDEGNAKVNVNEQTMQNDIVNNIVTSSPNDKPAEHKKAKKGNNGQRAIAGLGMGAVFGATAFGSGIVLGNISDKKEVEEVEPEGELLPEEEQPEPPTAAEYITNPEVKLAEGVTDDMSFNEAFAAARAEVGAGGVFEWHGQVYGTYTAEEWNNMSKEEIAEFNNSFSWNNYTTDYEDDSLLADNNSSGNDVVTEDVIVDGYTNDHAGNYTGDYTDDVYAYEEPEVEILGVMHDEESGANIAGVMIDDQEVYFIDVDQDNIVDYVAADFNGDGEFGEDELADISSEQISLNEFEVGMDSSFDDVVTDEYDIC